MAQMGEKKEDDEIVLQITFTFHRFLLFPETMAALVENSQVVNSLRRCSSLAV